MSHNETHTKFHKLIAECDQLIKDGKISAAVQLLSKTPLPQVPRPLRQSLAKICRRVDQFGRGLRLLQPLVRNEKKNESPATPGEICEYAVLLSRIGLRNEAIELLSGVSRAEALEASLYLAYCHIFNWDYARAIDPLKEFLNASDDPYAKIIARVNLVSSYIGVLELDHAENLVKETIPLAESLGARRLVGNCYELLGRIYLHRRGFSVAREALNKALSFLGDIQIYDRLFIEKWQAVILAMETESVDPLLTFKEKAVSLCEWESVRESDLFITKVQYDQKLYDHLVFGTPIEAYRKRIQEAVKGSTSPSYILGKKTSLCLDLLTGEVEGNANFSPGKKIHRVLAVLVKDFYSPRSTGLLFSDLYPGEYFDIDSSPQRVRQLLVRARRWLDENKIPAIIEQVDGNYRFMIQGDFGIRMTLEAPEIEASTVFCEQLKSLFPPGTKFSAKEACEALQWARNRFQYSAERALESGDLIRTGQGRSTSYEVSDRPRRAKAA